MFFKLFLIFVIIPLIELGVFIKIGTVIGVLYTFALIFFTAIVGAYMVRMEGLSVFYRFQENLTKGTFPQEEIFDGALILLAGALLITPGVLTDITGFLLVFPLSRGVVKKIIRRYIKKKISRGDIHIHFGNDL